MNNEQTNGSTGMNTLRAQLAKIEQERVRLMQELEAKVSKLPEHLGLGSLAEVLDLIRTKNDTGSVEAFAGAALPQRIDAPHLAVNGRRRGQRGKAIPSHIRDRVKGALLRNESGIDIARRENISPSTVSGIRKALEQSGELKN